MVVTPTEQRLADSINAAGRRPGSYMDEVALMLGAAFLLYRSHVRRELKEAPPVMRSTPDAIQELVTRIGRIYLPTWVATVVPALVIGYAMGLREADNTTPSQEWMKRSAEIYATRLGEHIHSVSTQALVEGVRAQTNRKIAAQVAIERSIDAFGVSPRTMKALVNVWMTQGDAPKALTAQARPTNILARVDAAIARGLTERAKAIGETESYLSKNTAKALYWAWQVKEGMLSPLAEKEWRTADDERVCPECGPMHGRTVPVGEPFTLPSGAKVLAPSTHPMCRCNVVLVESVQAGFDKFNTRQFALAKSVWGVVSKAAAGDPFNRDAQGQFARAEMRRPAPALASNTELTQQAVQIQAYLAAMADQNRLDREYVQATNEEIAAGERLAQLQDRPRKLKPVVRLKQQTKLRPARKLVVEQEKTSLAAPAKETLWTETKASLSAQDREKIKLRVQGTSVALAPLLRSETELSAMAERAPDNWVSTVPMYALVGEEDWEDYLSTGEVDVRPEIAFVFDKDQVSLERGRGLGLLEDLLSEHWSAVEYEILDDFFMEAEVHPGAEEYGPTQQIRLPDGTELFISSEEYENALDWEIRLRNSDLPGRDFGFEPNVVVPARYQDGTGHWRYGERPVSFETISDHLQIGYHVDINMPRIMRTQWQNTASFDADFGSPGNSASNPGVYRIVASNEVPVYGSKAASLPYILADIEPTDLYER